MKRFFFSLLFVLISVCSYCGNLIVSGIVYGHDKQPLSGASIDLYFKERSIYTITTDSKGHFSFEGLTKSDSLVFTYIGYSIGTYVVTGSAFVEIGLEREAFVPSKSLYGIVLQTKNSVKHYLYSDNANNDKSVSLDLYHRELRFTKIELGPGSQNLSKLDSILNRNLVKEIKLGRGGIHRIGFIIDKNGRLKDFVVIQSHQKDIDQKIFDLIVQNINWFSARQNGNATTAYCELSFKIDKKRINLIINSD